MEKFYSLKTLLKLAGGWGMPMGFLHPRSATGIHYHSARPYKNVLVAHVYK